MYKTTYYCDRCNAEIPVNQRNKRILISSEGTKKHILNFFKRNPDTVWFKSDDAMLCESCFGDLIKWFGKEPGGWHRPELDS